MRSAHYADHEFGHWMGEMIKAPRDTGSLASGPRLSGSLRWVMLLLILTRPKCSQRRWAEPTPQPETRCGDHISGGVLRLCCLGAGREALAFIWLRCDGSSLKCGICQASWCARMQHLLVAALVRSLLPHPALHTSRDRSRLHQNLRHGHRP